MIESVERIVSSSPQSEERQIERSLRPQFLQDYIGQEKLKRTIEIFTTAAKDRREALDHVLLYGPPGLGKTTLAYIIANELGVNLRATSGPAIERPGDLAAILTNLEEKDVLFIDEIHRLHRTVEEVLYSAMEDYAIDIVVGKGPSARTIRLDIPHFTLIGATTRAGMLSSPLRSRFGVISRLQYYEEHDLVDIIKRSAYILNVTIDPNGAFEIARRSRGTPRIANRILKRVRDYAQVIGDGIISQEMAINALNMLEVDPCGLDAIDRKLMLMIIQRFNGGPVGLNTMAAAINEAPETIDDVYEPFLLQKGFLQRTPRGRMATKYAYDYFGIAVDKAKETQKSIWGEKS